MMHAKTISKYQKLSIGKLKAKAQKAFNAFIRQRDQDQYGYFTCISCSKRKKIIYYRNDSGRVTGTNYHCGHFYAVGACEALRFSEKNAHGQCNTCNTHKHGNLIEYGRNLEKKIGKKALQELHDLHDYWKRSLKKWDRFDLVEIIEKYRI